MDVGKSVKKAIDEMEGRDLDSAMLHACNAVDGTAAKALPHLRSNNARFTTYLRQNYLTLGVMGMPGINLEQTRFPIAVQRPKAAGGQADLADIIYGIFRCNHGHGEALPDGFELLPDLVGEKGLTRIEVERGQIRISDRIIIALVAVAVFAPENASQIIPNSYHLTLGETHTFIISDWWGKRADFYDIASDLQLPSVVLDFGNWMTES